MDTQIFQLFQFKKPIIIEDSVKGGSAVVAADDKITLHLDKKLNGIDMAEILSRAKLGEQDPLLVTFMYQKNISPKEEEYAYLFFHLCQPLIDAWTYKTMRKYLPTTYKKEINTLVKMYETLNTGKAKITPETFRQHLSMWAILHENLYESLDVDNYIDIQFEKEPLDGWMAYLDFLKKSIPQEPSVNCLTKMPKALNLPFSVSIRKGDTGRYYLVKCR